RIQAVDNKSVDMLLPIGGRRLASTHNLGVTRLQGMDEAESQFRSRPALSHEKKSEGTTEAEKGGAKSHGSILMMPSLVQASYTFLSEESSRKFRSRRGKRQKLAPTIPVVRNI